MAIKFDFVSWYTSKRVEPKQRLVGGKFGHAFHRFPIKGGISMADIMADNVAKNNALMERIKKVK